MKNIEFSCLMSVYKKDMPENVKVAIDSILNQTVRPSEFVIMVDGPIMEDLKELLQKYSNKDNIIKLYFRAKNLGLGPTLNEGLNYCKYDLVARMDADDESLPDRFEKQIKYMVEHPDVDIVGTNVTEYDENLKEKLSERNVPESNIEIKQFIKYRNPMNHPSVIYKKQSVIEAGSYEEYPYFEDYQLWAKMASNGCNFYNMQEPLYKFRAGKDMYGRRGGVSYCKCIHKFEKSLKDLNLISNGTYLKNIIKRDIGAVIPNGIRGYLYKKLLRK